MFENAKWITRKRGEKPKEFLKTPIPYFIRDIEILKPVKNATLYVCGVGQSAYYFDGVRIPDSFRPGYPSYYNKTLIYNTFDITDILKVGNHRFGAIVGNIRVLYEHTAYLDKTPQMIAQIEIEYTDNSTETIVSDESFLTAPSPIVLSGSLYGDYYDARKEIANWNIYGSDILAFNKADVIEGYQGKFRTTNCPPIRIMEELSAVELKPGIFDFGKITSGHVKAIINGKKGAKIKLLHAERLTPDGNHAELTSYVAGPYPEIYNSDVYILNGEKDKVYEQITAFHGFRYVEVVGEYESITLTAYTSYTDMPIISHFKCNNEIINGIHNACVYSMQTCYQGMPLDNPKRDVAWLGDIMLDSEDYAQNFDCYNTLYEYCLQLIDSQTESGEFPTVAPASQSFWYGRNRFIGPDWGDSALLHITYYLYKYNKKIELLEKFYPAIEKTMNYFATLEENGLIKEDIAGTGDWSGLPTANPADISVISNGYYYWDLLLMAEISEELKKDADKYYKKAMNVRNAFREKYFKNGEFLLTQIGEIICTAYVGLLDDKEKEEVVRKIVEYIKNNGNAVRFGVHSCKMFASLLSDYGYGQLVFDVLTNTNALGYGKNIKDGLSTLPEKFDYAENSQMSLNHHFFSVIDKWFFNYLAGIKVNGFGFNNVVINPLFVEGIDTLKAQIHGIKVSYNSSELEISSPYAFTLILMGEKNKYPAGNYVFSR